MGLLRRLRAIGSLSALGFFTEVLASMGLDFFDSNNGFRTFLGITFGLMMVLYFSIWMFGNKLGNERNVFFYMFVFMILPTFFCFFSNRFMDNQTDFGTRVFVYSSISIGLSTMLCSLWPFITFLLIKDIINSANIKITDEIVLYVFPTVLITYLTSITIPISQIYLKKEKQVHIHFTTMIGWAIETITMGVIARFIDSRIKNDKKEVIATPAPSKQEYQYN